MISLAVEQFVSVEQHTQHLPIDIWWSHAHLVRARLVRVIHGLFICFCIHSSELPYYARPFVDAPNRQPNLDSVLRPWLSTFNVQLSGHVPVLGPGATRRQVRELELKPGWVEQTEYVGGTWRFVRVSTVWCARQNRR